MEPEDEELETELSTPRVIDVGDDEDLPPDPEQDTAQPEAWMEPEEVEHLNIPYSTRPPGSWIISGPLGLTWRKDKRGGRRFGSWGSAEAWAREKYGSDFIGPHEPLRSSDVPRWGFVIRARSN